MIRKIRSLAREEIRRGEEFEGEDEEHGWRHGTIVREGVDRDNGCNRWLFVQGVAGMVEEEERLVRLASWL